MPGCRLVLTSQNRSWLAADSSVYLLKTHEAPFDRYFDHEYVVQPVRNPGAVFWSYKHFLRDHEGRDLTLEQVIAGEASFGCWSLWHDRWDIAAEGLGDRFLRLRYEDVVQRRLLLCESLQRITGLPYDLSRLPESFAALHERMPTHIRVGRPDDWLMHWTASQVHEMLTRHGLVAGRLGYGADIESALGARRREESARSE
jgi:hypothetical protein